jgi:hypothetical protein
MFRIFRKKSKEIKNRPTFYQKIGVAVGRFHRNWANCLNRKTANIKTSTLKVVLFIFCATFGSICAYIGFNAIIKPSNVVKVDKIQIPSHIIIEDDKGAYRQAEISKQEYDNIQSFKKYMDSLKTDSKGRSLYDTIIAERPGLMDSISLAELLYLKQKK